MKRRSLNLALAGSLASAVALLAIPAKAQDTEKCYGVAGAGKNDCQTATASCAGSSTKDFDKAAFVAVPKGTCGKLAGGSLQPS